MRRVTVHHDGQVAVIEVEGILDSVTGHDLRSALDTVLRTTTGTINLDLSRVASADEDGVETLRWCSKLAIGSRRRLVWSQCSRPLITQLRASNSQSSSRQPLAECARE